MQNTRKKKFVEFEFNIDPSSLVSRIMSVREQISKEWIHDLEILVETSDQVLTVYNENQIEARDEGREEDGDEDIQKLGAPYRNKKMKDQGQQPVLVFNRDAMVMFSNSKDTQGLDSSPLRKSSFDLLLLLSTQESIHRILREYMQAGKSESFEWLREFYVERLEDHFDGPQRFGRADDFLEELLREPPCVSESSDGKVHLIDPMGMVEDIIRERSEVAREWRDIITETQNDHIGVRRVLFSKLIMGKSNTNADVEKPESFKMKEEKLHDLFEAGTFE